MKNLHLLLVLMIFSITFSSCDNDDDDDDNQVTKGALNIHFGHHYGNADIEVDKLIYTNAAGNPFEISEIQWFVSDITFYKNGNKNMIGQETTDFKDDVHYIDTDLPETFSIENVVLQTGQYDSIQITFGINEEKNKSALFSNQPESDMFWPELLGGGYHYMKFNGFFTNDQNQKEPFNLHLGIGQLRDSLGNITSYVQNYFTITLPASAFKIEANQETNIKIIMNVENWFNDPAIYDLNDFEMVMMNQQAQETARLNGIKNVFSFQQN